jgi:2-polyprenyl-3-methyl-5-hydroxy-6-metoxy-1,4-benzoquinol methylase
MIIEINSSNSNLSYILNKNPNSGFLIRDCRKGFIVGKYVNPLTYMAVFEEGVAQDSFEKEGNYLVYRGYCSAEAALTVLTTLFDCIKKDSNNSYEERPSLNTITIKCLDVDVKHLSIFNTEHFSITHYPIADNCNLVQLNVTNNGSLINVLRYTALLLFMQVVKDSVSYLTLDQVIVYANIIKKNDNIPFIVRHRFRGILEDNMSKKVVPLLNNNSIKLSNIGRNEQQRFAFVSQYIKYRNSVLDIGCGPGKYIKVSKATKYIGVDIDENVLTKAKSKAEYLNVEASFYTDYKLALEALTEPTTVLLIEVIEHLPHEEALDLIYTCFDMLFNNPGCIKNPNVKQILISTPNKDFNKYFNLEPDDVRYEDHLHEFTQQEFERFGSKESNVIWGDLVDGCPMTLYKNIELKE